MPLPPDPTITFEELGAQLIAARCEMIKAAERFIAAHQEASLLAGSYVKMLESTEGDTEAPYLAKVDGVNYAVTLRPGYKRSDKIGDIVSIIEVKEMESWRKMKAKDLLKDDRDCVFKGTDAVAESIRIVQRD